MAKVITLLSMLLAVALAEPPVHSSYLPPSARNVPSLQYGSPQASNEHSLASSAAYLPPSNNIDTKNNGAENNGYPSQPQNSYGPPPQGESQQDFASDSVAIDAPSSRSFSARTPSSKYGAPAAQPASRFGQAPNQLSARYNAPARSGQPSATYGAPFSARSNGFGASRGISSHSGSDAVNRYTAAIPSNTYGSPFNSAFDNNFDSPVSSYEAPRFGNGFSRSGGYPLARKTTTEDPLTEPAHYEYNYKVEAPEESGAEFGHREAREEELARGVYHVLLPDGRMQIVEYEADENGYRPNIRYEETGYPQAGARFGGY